MTGIAALKPLLTYFFTTTIFTILCFSISPSLSFSEEKTRGTQFADNRADYRREIDSQYAVIKPNLLLPLPETLPDQEKDPEDKELPLITIESLAENIEDAPEVLIAIAELEESISWLTRKQAENGFKVLGSAGTGHFKESMTENYTRTYNQTDISIGLRYPLLGNKTKENIAWLQAEEKTEEKRHIISLARRESLAALRMHFINYWGSRKKIHLCMDFLKEEQVVRKILRLRTQEGFLLDADRQELLTAFDLARRNLANTKIIKERALSTLSFLTKKQLNPFRPKMPNFQITCSDISDFISTAVHLHPEIKLLQDSVESKRNIAQQIQGIIIPANLDLIGSTTIEHPAEEPGYGVEIKFSTQFPLHVGESSSAEKKAVLLSLKAAQHKLKFKSSEVTMDAREAFQRFNAASEGLAFARQRLKASLELLRTSLLRAAYIEGDTIEQYYNNRFYYYKSAMDYIDSEIFFMQAQARMLMFVSGEGKNDNSSMGSSVKRQNESIDDFGYVCFGVYLWESQNLIGNIEPKSDFWRIITENRICRILLSLNNKQINDLDIPNNRKKLLDLFDLAELKNIEIELLLGEPRWILPAYRQNLLEIIRRLESFPFYALHLDLEPDQLDRKLYEKAYLLEQLVETLRGALKESPWPIKISIHPRYMDKKNSEFYIGTKLEKLGINEVTLMIYISNPARTMELAAPIINSNPGLTFSIAQSVEPGLNPEESYSNISRREFQDAMLYLKNNIMAKNFSTVIIQCWTDFLRLKQ